MQARSTAAASDVASQVLTPLEAAKVLKIGKDRMYSILKNNELYSRKIGKKARRIPAWAIEQYLRGEKPSGDSHAA